MTRKDRSMAMANGGYKNHTHVENRKAATTNWLGNRFGAFHCFKCVVFSIKLYKRVALNARAP